MAVAALTSLLPALVHATDYTSDHFILRDPVITVEGGLSTSTSFQYFSSTGQVSTGESTSASFTHRAGFLYFPVVTSPSLTATAVEGGVSLSWTASTVALGFSISGYEVGRAVTAGGPYTFTGVGTALSTTQTGLTSGARYYYVVRAFDALGTGIATSTEASAVPFQRGGGGIVSSSASADGGGSAAGPAVPPAPAPGKATVTFHGLAYPSLPVLVLQDGEVAATVTADPVGRFQLTLPSLTPGRSQFTLYAQDGLGRRSETVAVPLQLSAGEAAAVFGVFFSPTIAADLSSVARGDVATVEGWTAAGAKVLVVGSGPAGEFIATVAAAADGRYQYRVDSSRLQLGEYRLRSKASLGGQASDYNLGVPLVVGTRSVPAPAPPRCAPADFNGDCRVNIVDFSILLYWFYRPHPAGRVDLSGDGRVDLVDFSILVYHWTG